MKRKIFISTLLTFLTISTPIAAYAYTLTGYKWQSSNVYYYYENWNSSSGKVSFAEAAAEWNITEASLSYRYPSYNITINEGTYPDVEWDGVTHRQIRVGTSYFSSAQILINTALPSWNNLDMRKSVIVHEFGHALGLEDVTGKKIMNWHTIGDDSRYETYGLTKPQSDDINGINAIY